MMIETLFEEDCCAPVVAASRGTDAPPEARPPPQPMPQPARPPAAEPGAESRRRRVLVVELL
jgi:hypothetical protein